MNKKILITKERGIKFSFLLFVFLSFNISIAQTGEINQIESNLVENVISYSIEESHLLLICNSQKSKNPVFIQISLPFADAPKIQITLNENQLKTISGEKFDLIDNEKTIEIKSKSTRICISKSDLIISIFRGDELLLSQQVYTNIDNSSEYIRVLSKCSSDEHFYGFGEKFNGLDQSGKKVIMELNDAYMSDDDSTYKSIPFFISSKKYGLLVNSYQRVVFNMRNQNEKEYDFVNPNSSIEYFVFTNKDPLTIISQYTEISGRSPIIPKWSLEPWLSRRRMTGWNSPNSAESDIDHMLNDNYRLGVVLWEGFRMMFQPRFGNQASLLSNKWHGYGIKQVCWDYTGHIQKHSPFFTNCENNYFLRYSDSTICYGHRSGNNVYIDPTNDSAMTWWKKNLYEKRFLGVDGQSTPDYWNLDGIKLDFSELFPKEDTDLLNIDKAIGMHNQHAVLFSEEIYNWLQYVKPEGGITWVRGGGLGIQKVGYAWGGDRGRTFEQMRGTISASLGVSICGVSLIGHDLGGYRGGNSEDERKVYIRGVQYATFSPSFHDHGSAPAPWEQDEFGNENYRFYSRVRYNIIPYLYHYVKVSNKTGIPMMRTLFLHHPNDEKTFNIEDQYYLGDYIIIAPIVTNSNNREIYLPEGDWIDFWNNTEFRGQKSFNYSLPLNRIPIFVKKNTILPLKLNDAMEFGGIFSQENKNNLLLSFRFFKGNNSQFEFFGDNKIDIEKRYNEDSVIIDVNNIDEHFGLIVDGYLPNQVTVNGNLINQLTDSLFVKSHEGWRFDKKSGICYLKVEHKSKINNYKIVLDEIIKHEVELSFDITELDSPDIIQAVGWDKSVELFFDPVKTADSYLIKYWENGSPNLVLDTIIVDNTVSIPNLLNNKSYSFNISSIYNSKIFTESNNVNVTPKCRTAFFKTEEEQIFIKANHFLKIEKNDSSSKLTYGLYSEKDSKKVVWAKIKNNQSHYLYYRWYKMGSINLKKGDNYFTFIKPEKIKEIDKLYFSDNEEDLPSFLDEKESGFLERDPKIENEIILEPKY